MGVQGLGQGWGHGCPGSSRKSWTGSCVTITLVCTGTLAFGHTHTSMSRLSYTWTSTPHPDMPVLVLRWPGPRDRSAPADPSCPRRCTRTSPHPCTHAPWFGCGQLKPVWAGVRNLLSESNLRRPEAAPPMSYLQLTPESMHVWKCVSLSLFVFLCASVPHLTLLEPEPGRQPLPAGQSSSH